MNYRMPIVFIGIAIAVIGFAFAFSSMSSKFDYEIQKFGWNFVFSSVPFALYPNLITGAIIGIGGIVVAIIGAIYFRKQKSN